MSSAVHRMESQWGIPHKHALFGSEGHYLEPPDDGYPVVTQSGLLHENDSREEACSPSRRLEIAVARLQKDIADYRKEIKVSSVQSTAIPSRPTKRSGFTLMPVPRFSGKSSREQYRQVFEAIACSNGWNDVTAALQLLSHLDGDALNVALQATGSLITKCCILGHWWDVTI